MGISPRTIHMSLSQAPRTIRKQANLSNVPSSVSERCLVSFRPEGTFVLDGVARKGPVGDTLCSWSRTSRSVAGRMDKSV
eukprot:292302-Amphidinium_carterae.1